MNSDISEHYRNATEEGISEFNGPQNTGGHQYIHGMTPGIAYKEFVRNLRIKHNDNLLEFQKSSCR